MCWSVLSTPSFGHVTKAYCRKKYHYLSFILLTIIHKNGITFAVRGPLLFNYMPGTTVKVCNFGLEHLTPSRLKTLHGFCIHFHGSLMSLFLHHHAFSLNQNRNQVLGFHKYYLYGTVWKFYCILQLPCVQMLSTFALCLSHYRPPD